MITPKDVVVDPVLSNVSVAYTNDSYIAEILLPVFEVQKQNGKYYKFDKSSLRRNKTLRAPGSGANEVEYGLTTAPYGCEDHALKEKVPFEVIDQADGALDPEMDATESVTEMLLVDKEIALSASMADSNVITNGVTLSGTDQWDDTVNSDPIGDIQTAISSVQAATGKTPNTLVFSQPVFNALIAHPDIIDRIKYVVGGAITPEIIARLFDVERVIVGKAVYNSAKEGQTDSLGFIWGKNAYACYIAAGKPKLKQVTLGYHFTYKKRVAEKWDDADAKSRYVRVSDNYDANFVAAEACYRISNAIS